MRLSVFACQKNVKQSKNVKLDDLYFVVRNYFVFDVVVVQSKEQ